MTAAATVQDEHSHRIQPAHGQGDFELWLGGETVVLSKVFGPLILADIRVRPDFQSCEWVIEREYHRPHLQHDDCPPTEWREVMRISGQVDADHAGHEND